MLESPYNGAVQEARVAELEALVEEWKDAAHENAQVYGKVVVLRAVAEAAERALATLEWLTKGHDERPHAGDPSAWKCRACEEKERLAVVIAAASIGTSRKWGHCERLDPL
jgi:hypothetical protein